MLQPIKLITKREELEGTCYFEIMPGKYVESCWNEGSIFIDDDVFTLIEPPFERHVPDYDHYAFTDVYKKQWEMIVNDLSTMKYKMSMLKNPSELRGVLEYATDSAISDFLVDFDSNRKDTIVLIDELTAWIQVQLNSHDCLSVLGL